MSSFDLKKYLVENKLTSNSRSLKEDSRADFDTNPFIRRKDGFLEPRDSNYIDPTIDYKAIATKLDDVEVEDIETRDYPDFSNAFLSSAIYKDRYLSDRELDEVQYLNPDWFYSQIERYIY